MNAHINYISYRLSSVTDDIVTVGLIWVEGNNSEVYISKTKLAILKKLIPKSYYTAFTDTVLKYPRNTFNFEQLDFLHRYQNGMIRFSKPTPFGGVKEQAESIFKKYIDSNYGTD